ncbi:MAG: hypothetical protein E7773_14275 [Sphingomonas sp.]|uniref:hypothetical protein n=1 Tax=Sphingomonas sp. TaxID=28214 RepID=UPI001214261C|nr:hypothetical protein [Sphingomonas sp.]THD34821.1 MAG: hypothetical protein E7773_14275 [Sphingomonas sp.]
MPNPLSRTQQLENAAFLRHLRRTGNASTAARALGFGRGRFIVRRNKHPAFALQWDAALAIAHADLMKGRDGAPVPPPHEPYIRRSKSGRLQLRRSQVGLIDHAGRQRFLAALSATANVRLSAAAARFDPGAFYRLRHRDPGFAREWLLALEMGYERLKMALAASWLVESHADDDWRHNEPPEMPPMTPAQALHLMHLHQKEVVLGSKPLTGRLRPGETSEARSAMLALLYEARQEREELKYRIAEAERQARGEPTYHRWEPGDLPDLAQVTGWSQANGKPGTDPGRAWSGDGGWRIFLWGRGMGEGRASNGRGVCTSNDPLIKAFDAPSSIDVQSLLVDR